MKALLSVALVLVSAFALWAADDVTHGPSCKYCGMDREKYAFSRVVIEYDQSEPAYFCSIHCAAVDLAVNIDRSPIKLLVGDYGTKKLINAETAFWVIGGDKTGVMTKRAKWAFESKTDADKFVESSGGLPATFDEVMAATYGDMYQDSKMIRERRAMKRKASEQHKP